MTWYINQQSENKHYTITWTPQAENIIGLVTLATHSINKSYKPKLTLGTHHIVSNITQIKSYTSTSLDKIEVHNPIQDEKTR